MSRNYVNDLQDSVETQKLGVKLTNPPKFQEISGHLLFQKNWCFELPDVTDGFQNTKRIDLIVLGPASLAVLLLIHQLRLVVNIPLS